MARLTTNGLDSIVIAYIDRRLRGGLPDAIYGVGLMPTYRVFRTSEDVFYDRESREALLQEMKSDLDGIVQLEAAAGNRVHFYRSAIREQDGHLEVAYGYQVVPLPVLPSAP